MRLRKSSWYKSKNADGLRRTLEPVSAEPIPESSGIAPLLQKLMADYAATGLPPAYLPFEFSVELIPILLEVAVVRVWTKGRVGSIPPGRITAHTLLSVGGGPVPHPERGHYWGRKGVGARFSMLHAIHGCRFVRRQH
jgi:hypothetical protein